MPMDDHYLNRFYQATLIPLFLRISICLLIVSCSTEQDIKTNTEAQPNPEFEVVADIEFSQKYHYRPWIEAQSFCLSQNLKLPKREQLLAVYQFQKYFAGDGPENSSYWTNEKNVFIYGGNVLIGNDETRSSVRCVK